VVTFAQAGQKAPENLVLRLTGIPRKMLDKSELRNRMNLGTRSAKADSAGTL